MAVPKLQLTVSKARQNQSIGIGSGKRPAPQPTIFIGPRPAAYIPRPAPSRRTPTWGRRPPPPSIWDRTTAFSEGVGASIGQWIPQTAGFFARTPTATRFLKPVLPTSVDRSIESGIVQPNRRFSDRTFGAFEQKYLQPHQPFVQKDLGAAKAGMLTGAGITVVGDIATGNPAAILKGTRGTVKVINTAKQTQKAAKSNEIGAVGRNLDKSLNPEKIRAEISTIKPERIEYGEGGNPVGIYRDVDQKKLDVLRKRLESYYQTKQNQEAKQIIDRVRVVKPPALPRQPETPITTPVRESGKGIEDAIKAGKAERKRSEKFAEGSIPKRHKVKDFTAQHFTDDTLYFQELDRQIAKTRGVKVTDLPAVERLDPTIQAFRNAKAIQKQRYDDLGISDFAAKLSDNKKYDAYRIYRTYRTNAERAAQNAKRNESVEQAYRRFSGGRDMATDQQLAQKLDQDPMYPQLFAEENAITRNILRERGRNPNLTETPEQVEDLIARYPNYTPQYRTLSEDLIQFRRQGNVGSQQGANVKKLQGGSVTKPIEDPLTALRNYSDELVAKSQGNEVMNILVREFPDKFRPLVTADQLIAKEQAKITLGELGASGRTIQRDLSKNRKALLAVGREINQLEKAQGGKTTLKPTPNQITLRLADMTDSQAERLAASLDRKDVDAARLMRESSVLRQQADEIKSAKAGIINSGDLAAIEKAANKNTKRRVVNNREELYEVTDPRLAQNLDNLKGHQLSKAAQVLGVPTRFFKFFTTGPGNIIAFPPIAITRDVLASILFAKAPLRAAFDPRSYVDAFAVAAKKGEFYRGLQRRGISGTMVEGDRVVKAVTSDAMRNRGLKRVKVYAKKPGQLLRDIEEADMAIERFTRGRLASGQYRKQLKKYKKDPSLTSEQARDMALWDAAEEFREGALNFGRSGDVTREINSVAAYLNPAVQAGNKMRRSIRERPAAFAARASLATTLLYGGWAYSHSSKERQEIYDSLGEEERRGNIVLVGPGAKFDKEKGRATGIIKIPLPYEFRAFQMAVEQKFKSAPDEEYGELALSAIAALTGMDTRNMASFIGQFVPTQAKGAIENVTNFSFFTGKELTPKYIKEQSNNDKTQEVRNSTSGTARFISQRTGGWLSPIEADNLLKGAFGGASRDILSVSDSFLKKTGRIAPEHATDSNPVKRLKDRYTQAYGESGAVKFFASLENERKKLPSQKDREALDFLHAKNPQPGILDSVEKATIFLNRPKVVGVERRLDADNRKRGQPGNPLFDLSDDQLQKVLAYRQAKMLNAGKQTYDKNGNPLFTSLGLDEKWYEDYRTKENQFYAKLPKSNKPSDSPKSFSGAEKPKAPPGLQAKIDRYYTLKKDTGERSRYLRANPDILAYWEAGDGFTNQERLAIGLKPLGDKESGGSGGGNFASRGVRVSRGGRRGKGNRDRELGPAAPKRIAVRKPSQVNISVKIPKYAVAKPRTGGRIKVTRRKAAR